MKTKDAIILFGKYPRQGFVKTRLARSIGDQKATEFYERCLGHVFAEAEELTNSHDVFFYFAEAEDEVDVKKLAPKSFRLVAQPKQGLSDRVRSAFEYVFDRGYDRVVIFPTDVPELDANIMDRACIALTATDCVIGPDSDGGYYCLGMRSYSPALLGVTYGGTDGMYQQTLRNAANNGLTHTALPEISDIDTIDDLYALKLRNPRLWSRDYSDI